MTFEEYRKLCERRKELTLIGSHTYRNELMEINKKINRVNNGLYMPQISVKDFKKAFYDWAKKNKKSFIFDTSELSSGYIKIIMGLDEKTYLIFTDPLTDKFETEFLKQSFLNSPQIENLIADYPSVIEIIWDLVKKELQKPKTEQISIINKMISEKKDERETYIDEQKRSAKIISLTNEIDAKIREREKVENTLDEF